MAESLLSCSGPSELLRVTQHAVGACSSSPDVRPVQPMTVISSSSSEDDKPPVLVKDRPAARATTPKCAAHLRSCSPLAWACVMQTHNRMCLEAMPPGLGVGMLFASLQAALRAICCLQEAGAFKLCEPSQALCQPSSTPQQAQAQPIDLQAKITSPKARCSCLLLQRLACIGLVA